ncbi:MAG: hypothetical protein K8R68_01585 [Bacteroidales bacterium]|nr:hypothetical protein [Bacteroidales bacterium]
MYFRKCLKNVQILAATLLIIFSACQKDRPTPSWQVDLLAPLLIDTVTITDVISERLVTVNPDHSVSFYFDELLYEVNADSLVKLPDTLFHWGYSLEWMPFNIHLPPGDLIIEETFDWPLDYEAAGLEGIALESAIIRSGVINFELFNESEGSILSEFGINTAIRNETDTFFISETIPSGQVIKKAYDISGYRLGLTGSDGDTVNMLNYFLGLYADPSIPDTLLLTPVDSFSVNIYFEDLVIDYAKGNFGTNTFTFGPEVSGFYLFEDLNIGGFSMQGATILLRVQNNYGVDGLVKLLEIMSVNSETGENASLEGEMMDSNLYVDAAVQYGDGLQMVQPTENIFDFSNSNFNDLVKIMPDQVLYTIQLLTNPNGDTIGRDHFLYYEEPIRVFMEVEVNQGVLVQDLFTENSISWNGEGVSFDNVESGILTIVLDNGFPFSFDANIYLEDEDHIILDTLVFQDFVASGLLDNEFKVEQAVETRIQLALTNEMKESVMLARFARYEMLINSANNEHVKIYDSNIMAMKIIGDFTYTIEQ